MTGSGDRATPGGALGEYEFLRRQAGHTWVREWRRLSAWGVRDGAAILDLGCGPGWVTDQLAGACPSSMLVGVDHDSEKLAVARARSAHGAGTRHFVEAKVERTGLAPESFDLVYSRLVFHYLENPGAAAAEAFRLLRPGGLLVVVDVDDGLFGVTTPELPELALVQRRVAEARARKGGNRHRGRHLPALLAEAGFRPVEIESLVIDSAETGLVHALPQLDPANLRSLAQAGILSGEEERSALAARERFLADPSAQVLRLFLMACGCKPARPA